MSVNLNTAISNINSYSSITTVTDQLQELFSKVKGYAAEFFNTIAEFIRDTLGYSTPKTLTAKTIVIEQPTATPVIEVEAPAPTPTPAAEIAAPKQSFRITPAKVTLLAIVGLLLVNRCFDDHSRYMESSDLMDRLNTLNPESADDAVRIFGKDAENCLAEKLNCVNELPFYNLPDWLLCKSNQVHCLNPLLENANRLLLPESYPNAQSHQEAVDKAELAFLTLTSQ